MPAESAVSIQATARAVSGGPVAALDALLEKAELRPDPMQRQAAERLQELHDTLQGYQPAPPQPERKGLLGLFGLGGGRREEPAPAPQGLYIFGPVGRGKSMLMDLFYETAPIAEKRRVHFHAFMQEMQ